MQTKTKIVSIFFLTVLLVSSLNVNTYIFSESKTSTNYSHVSVAAPKPNSTIPDFPPVETLDFGDPPPPYDPDERVYADYTTFTEVDPNSHITIINATHVNTTIILDESAYIYKDMGANYFGNNFTNYVDAQIKNPTSTSGWAVVWAISDYVGSISEMRANSAPAIHVFAQHLSGTRMCFGLTEEYNGIEYKVIDSPYSGYGWYYFTIIKDETNMTCFVHTDSARTSLLSTLELTLHDDWEFKYIYGVNSYDANAPTIIANHDIAYLDIGEVGFAEHFFESSETITLSVTDRFVKSLILLSQSSVGVSSLSSTNFADFAVVGENLIRGNGIYFFGLIIVGSIALLIGVGMKKKRSSQHGQ